MDTTPGTTPESALAKALDRLLTARTLTRPQADAVRTEFDAERSRAGALTPSTPVTSRPDGAEHGWSSMLSEVGGYVGATFVFAAAVALVRPFWSDLSHLARVFLLAVPAVALLAAALAIVYGPRPGTARSRDGGTPRHRLVSALALAGGALLGAAAGVLTEDGSPEQVVPAVLLVAWGLAYVLWRGSLLHVAAAAGLTAEIVAATDRTTHSLLVTGLALVVAGTLWAGAAAGRLIQEDLLGIVVGGALAFAGAETVVAGDVSWLGYVLLAAVATIGLAAYLRTHVVSALAVGGVALAVVVPQAVIDYTDGSLGAAGALLVSGLSIVGVSVAGMRLHKERT
jgi:hypothetical protein